MNLTLNKKTKGLIAAGAVSGFQSFESILLVLFGVVMSVAVTKEVYFAGATMLLKETFSFGLMLLTSSPFLMKNIIKKIRTRQGLYFVIAAVLGTSLGNICFLLAVFNAGSGYGVILTALYPAITITLLNWVLKEKENWKVWFGVLFTMVSSGLFILLPAVIEGKSIDGKVILGMCLGGATALFWSIEGLFINIGIKGPNEWTNKEVMATRSFFTALMSIAVIAPLTSAFGGNAFKMAGEILSGYKSALLVTATAINIFLLRITSIYAIRAVGAKVTSVIDTFNFIIPAVFTAIFSTIPGVVGERFADNTIVWWAFLLVIPILIGVFISVYFQKPEDKKKEALHLEPK